MPEVFEVDGWDAFQEALARQPEVAVPIIIDSMDKVGAIVTGRVKAIPPAGPGNQPGRVDRNGQPMGFYERGRGMWYPTKNLSAHPLKSKGEMRAPKALRDTVQGYKLGRKTSEQLSRSFAWTKPAPGGDGTSIEVTVGNNASYTLDVVGPHGKQEALFKKIGWVSIDDALADSDDDIKRICQDALDLLAKDFTGGTHA